MWFSYVSIYDSFSICEYNYTCIHMYIMWQLSNSNDHCHKDREYAVKKKTFLD